MQDRENSTDGTIHPVDGRIVPRYAGPPTFARLPRIDQVTRPDAVVVGAAFDGGATYRPGARFGPQGIRAASRLLRAYHPQLEVEPFASIQAADAGDLALNPFDVSEALKAVEAGIREFADSGAVPIMLGGDHTVALGALRALRAVHGAVALIHFDAHLDTWDTYFGAAYTHGSVLRRAAEEGLFTEETSIHVGIRGSLYGSQDLTDDARLGFGTISAWEVDELGVAEIAQRIRRRVGDGPVYLSIDIDVLDPAFAPGTGTPEVGGLTTRELLQILRATAVGLPLVGADIVEVSPVYDHAEVTALAAANVVYDLISVIAVGR